jgi:hypothetical protein
MTEIPIFKVAGNAPKIVSTRVIALYHPVTGRIHHLHTVHVHQGGRAIPEAEAIDEAHMHAKRLGHETRDLKVKVSENAEHGHRPHRIDPSTGEFARALSEASRK